MGSVVVSRKVESWAGSETAGMTNSQAESQNVGAQYAAPLPQRMARSPDVTSELVAQRHQQRSRQNRAREEQAAFKPPLHSSRGREEPRSARFVMGEVAAAIRLVFWAAQCPRRE